MSIISDDLTPKSEKFQKHSNATRNKQNPQRSNETAQQFKTEGKSQFSKPISNRLEETRKASSASDLASQFFSHGASKLLFHESLMKKDENLNEIQNPSKWNSLIVVQNAKAEGLSV